LAPIAKSFLPRADAEKDDTAGEIDQEYEYVAADEAHEEGLTEAERMAERGRTRELGICKVTAGKGSDILVTIRELSAELRPVNVS
jgi:hypothetical protein